MYVTYVRYENFFGSVGLQHKEPWGRVYFNPSDRFSYWHNTLNRPSECIWIIPGTAETE